jgi:7-cyano-7-deazaguanine synthase
MPSRSFLHSAGDAEIVGPAHVERMKIAQAIRHVESRTRMATVLSIMIGWRANGEGVSVDKIAVLASGGLDSSVLIAQMASDAAVSPIYVRCGFAWEEEEIHALRSFLDALNNANVQSITLLSAPAASLYGTHWSISGARVPAADEPDDNTYLPGRNILLISLAAIWGSTHDVSRVAIGSLGGNPFADASPQFFEIFGQALSTGLGRKVLIEAPMRGLLKEDLIRRFQNLPLELTLTCMAPRNSQHCGQCNKCYERQKAFRQAAIIDRAVYLS